MQHDQMDSVRSADSFPTDLTDRLRPAGLNCWSWPTATPWSCASARWPSGSAMPPCGCWAITAPSLAPQAKVAVEGSEIVVHVENHGDLDTTVHRARPWLENRYDGVPHETQAPIPVGGEFSYRLQFPDPGLYWYHPYIREDYTQELGLYGNIQVLPADPDYRPPADRDLILTLDDILIEDGKVALQPHRD